MGPNALPLKSERCPFSLPFGLLDPSYGSFQAFPERALRAQSVGSADLSFGRGGWPKKSTTPRKAGLKKNLHFSVRTHWSASIILGV
jgi:hypothetical protein